MPVVGSSGFVGWHDRPRGPGPGVTIGRSGVIGGAQYVAGPYWPLNTTLYVTDFRGNDPKYVYYALKSLDFGEYNSGSAQPSLNRNYVSSLPVPLAPAHAQQAIASALSAYDDLIENNTRRIRILEEMAQATYREWFVEFRFPGHEAAPMVESELGQIPNDWEATRLSDAVTTQYGYTESASAEPIGPRFLRGMDINKADHIDWSSVPYCRISDEERSKFQLARGDILVIRMADPGKVGIVEKDVDAIFASYLVRLRVRAMGGITPYFLFYTLLHDDYQAFARGAATGTTRGSLSAIAMTSFTFARPPVGLQDAFQESVRPLRQLANNLLDQNRCLRQTRDLLLPRLISGEIDVSNLDTPRDEPIA